MGIEACCPTGAIERFHVGIIRRLPWPGELNGDVVMGGPQVDNLTAEFAPVVTAQHLRRAPVTDELREDRDPVCPSKVLADLDGQTLPCEDIEHGQGAKPAPIRQLVGDKVELAFRKCEAPRKDSDAVSFSG